MKLGKTAPNKWERKDEMEGQEWEATIKDDQGAEDRKFILQTVSGGHWTPLSWYLWGANLHSLPSWKEI